MDRSRITLRKNRGASLEANQVSAGSADESGLPPNDAGQPRRRKRRALHGERLGNTRSVVPSRCTAPIAALAVSSSSAGAESPHASPLGKHAPAQVLAIGNSYTDYPRMPATIFGMARAENNLRELHAKVIAVPAATLERH